MDKEGADWVSGLEGLEVAFFKGKVGLTNYKLLLQYQREALLYASTSESLLYLDKEWKLDIMHREIWGRKVKSFLREICPMKSPR